jgi:hypothetical protein
VELIFIWNIFSIPIESQVLKRETGYNITKKNKSNQENKRSHKLGFTLNMVFGRNSPVIRTIIVARMVCISVIKNSFPIGLNQGVNSAAISKP